MKPRSRAQRAMASKPTPKQVAAGIAMQAPLDHKAAVAALKRRAAKIDTTARVGDMAVPSADDAT